MRPKEICEIIETYLMRYNYGISTDDIKTTRTPNEVYGLLVPRLHGDSASGDR